MNMMEEKQLEKFIEVGVNRHSRGIMEVPRSSKPMINTGSSPVGNILLLVVKLYITRLS